MRDERIKKSDEAWRAQLSPEQYAVCRTAGTEQAFTGRYHDHKEKGIYHCCCCGQPLFASSSKFDSGTGWPSFWDVAREGAVSQREDTRHGMRRVEILCAACDAHLGHIFDDGPDPTGLRYCVNSAALNFEKASDSS